MEILELLRDFLWNFKFKFKFKFKVKCYVLLMTVFCVSITGVNSTSDYVQSFERVAVFHNHVTYGHLGVTIDFDGYLNHFQVLRKSVLSFEEKHMSVYVNHHSNFTLLLRSGYSIERSSLPQFGPEECN